MYLLVPRSWVVRMASAERAYRSTSACSVSGCAHDQGRLVPGPGAGDTHPHGDGPPTLQHGVRCVGESCCQQVPQCAVAVAQGHQRPLHSLPVVANLVVVGVDGEPCSSSLSSIPQTRRSRTLSQQGEGRCHSRATAGRQQGDSRATAGRQCTLPRRARAQQGAGARRRSPVPRDGVHRLTVTSTVPRGTQADM